jgi:hypothetical protein
MLARGWSNYWHYRGLGYPLLRMFQQPFAPALTGLILTFSGHDHEIPVFTGWSKANRGRCGQSTV